MRAGSICDPAGRAGRDVAAVARHRPRHRDARSADDIAEELDSRGISLTIDGHAASVLARLHVPRRGLRAGAGARSATSSWRRRCPRTEIATRKGEVITAIRQDEDNPAVRATEALMALLYPDGASVRPARRRARSRSSRALTRERLRRAARRALRAERADGGRRRRRRRRPRARTSRRACSAAGGSRRRRRSRRAAGRAGGRAAARRHPDDEQGAGRHRLRVHDDRARAIRRTTRSG